MPGRDADHCLPDHSMHKGIEHRARFLSPKFPGDALRLGGWPGFHRRNRAPSDAAMPNGAPCIPRLLAGAAHIVGVNHR